MNGKIKVTSFQLDDGRLYKLFQLSFNFYNPYDKIVSDQMF